MLIEFFIVTLNIEIHQYRDTFSFKAFFSYQNMIILSPTATFVYSFDIVMYENVILSDQVDKTVPATNSLPSPEKTCLSFRSSKFKFDKTRLKKI